VVEGLAGSLGTPHSIDAVREIYSRMAELEREGRRYAVCTVVRTTGSTPQVVGAKMLVDDLGRITGTLGGGCVEGDAFDEAKQVIGRDTGSLREYELTEDLAWDTGLVCGGTMWISIEPGDRALRVGDRELLGDLLAASTGGRPVALATLLRKRGRDFDPAGKLYVETDGRSGGTLGDGGLDDRAREVAAEALRQGTARVVPLDDGAELLVEPVVAKPHLVVAGGGHVGLAIARQAALLDYQVTVIEDRAEFASRERFPEGVEVMHADMVQALETMPIGWNTFIVVATRGHKLDAHCLRAAVKTQARYVGLLGSKRKTILIERMLRDEGIPEERIRSVRAPVGLDLGGRTPAEIALSIVAELSAERYGGSARPLHLPAEIYERAVAKTPAAAARESPAR
jgi:xanthine dehydrogenase accessory factor